MERSVPHRLIWFTSWGILIATVIVCAIGLHLTWSRYRDMEGILLDAEKRAAKNQIPALQALIAEHERSALEDIARAGAPSSDDSAAFTAGGGFLEWPFLIEEGGSVRTPGLRPLGTTPTNGSRLAPRELERVLRIASSDASLEEKLQALDGFCSSPIADEGWRSRPATVAAALCARGGRLEEAERRFEAVARRLDGGPQETTPARLHLALARAEVLVGLSKREAASSTLLSALEHPNTRSSAPIERVEFFVERATAIVGNGSPVLRRALKREERRLATERAARKATTTLCDWIWTEHLARGGDVATGAQHFFVRSADRAVSAVWTPLSPASTGSRFLAVGAHINIDHLRTALETRLAPRAQGAALRVFVAQNRRPGSYVSLASFPGELSVLELGLDAEEWHRVVGKARQPFVFAGALICLLGAVLVVSLTVLMRGIRREFALSRMKTEFVASVSHELKTPLALIHLCAETLLLDRVPSADKRSKYCSIIMRESTRLGHLISNVLSIAKIEAGKESYRLTPCHLGNIVRDTLASYTFHLEESGFRHSLEVDPDLPSVLADEEAVAQAVINLLENATKYSLDEKEIEVSVRSVGGTVRVAVRDHGVGIAFQDQEHIWKDFYRAGHVRHLGTRGSGLGLSLVQHILRGHGGSVELVSEPGKGSEFTLVFPVPSTQYPATAGHDNHRGEVRDAAEDPGHRG